MASTTPIVYLTDDHKFKYDIATDDTSTDDDGNPIAATGLTVKGMFCAAEPDIGASSLDATDIGSTETTMTETSGKDGRYIGYLAHAALVAALGSSVGDIVYEVITIGTVVAHVQPVRVRKYRKAS